MMTHTFYDSDNSSVPSGIKPLSGLALTYNFMLQENVVTLVTTVSVWKLVIGRIGKTVSRREEHGKLLNRTTQLKNTGYG